MDIEIVMPTSDKSLWILPIVFYFFDKYLPKNYPITILGFKTPSFELPENYTFHSMGETQNIRNWSRDIYNYTKTLDTKYIMFILDDFLLLDHLRIDKLNEIIIMMDKNSNIGLCNIGMAPQYQPNQDLELINEDDFFLFQQNSKYYQINAQPSIYRLSHFNKYFNKSNDPWQLELNKQHQQIPEKLICCSPLNKTSTLLYPEKHQTPIYKTQLSSGLSGKMFPGKINMEGAKPEDIENLINMGLIEKDIIIYK